MDNLAIRARSTASDARQKRTRFHLINFMTARRDKKGDKAPFSILIGVTIEN
jgi:hypothetical protein